MFSTSIRRRLAWNPVSKPMYQEVGQLLERFEQQFLNFAVLSSIATIIVALKGFLLVKILSLSLSKADFGHYALSMSIAILLGTLCGWGFSGGGMRYLVLHDVHGDKRAVQDLLTTALGATVASGVLYSSIVVIAANLGIISIINVENEIDFLLVISIIGITTAVNTFALYGIIRAYSWGWMFLFSTLAIEVTNFAGGLALLWIWEKTTIAFLLGFMLGGLLGTSVLCLVLLMNFGIGRFSLPTLTKLIEFSFPFLIASGAVSFLLFSSNEVLQTHHDSRSIAILSVAMTVGNIIVLASAGFVTSYSPSATRLYDQSPEKLSRFLNLTWRYLLAGLVFLGLLIYATASFMIVVVSSEKYLDAVPIMPLIIVVFISQVFTNLALWGLALAQRMDLYARNHLLALVLAFFPLLLLGKYMELAGVLLAMTIFYMILLILSMWDTQRLIGVSFEKRLIIPFLCGIIAFVPLVVLQDTIPATSISIGIYFLLIVLTGSIRHNELHELYVSLRKAF